MIPNEAIAAAAKAFIEHGTLIPALEAAAPYIRACAWDGGYEAGKSDAFAADKGFTGYHVNPDRKYLD